MFTANTVEWPTPQPFFDALDREFRFTLDAAATAENAKCVRFYTTAEDGLAQEWRGTVWCNPPFGRGVDAWVEKGYRSAQAGATVVMLLPVRSDTAWWHAYVMRAAEIRFVRKRIAFDGTKSKGHNAPFPCAVVVFRPGAHVPRIAATEARP